MGIKSLFKHLLLTIVVLSMYACGGGGESSHKTIIEVQKQQSTNLVFADQKLTDCVQALIDSEGFTLVEQITELTCSGKDIVDIEGIQNLSSLEILDLSQNQIRDITPISKLGRLKQLYLQGNNLQLLSPITANQLLEQVDISDNGAIICSERAKLDQSIGEENITANQPCVDSMQQAETATFEDTNLQACIRQTAQDIGAQHLEQIQQLKCVNRDISNIDGIELLANLRELDLTQNNISDITSLQGLALLKKVLLGNNQISNMQPLTASQYMQELRLDHNQLTDIQAVQTLKALRQIHLTNNQIRDLTPLQSLAELLELRISNNRIIDIQPLANLPKLTSLWIQGNQIADLAPLQQLQHLEQLWLSNNWLTDLTPLQTQSKLKWLHLDGTEAADLNPLNELTQLKWLQLDNTRVEDITAIYPLIKLDWLHLKGNNTIPCNQLDHMEDLITAEKIDRPETCSQPQEQTGNPISTIEFQDKNLRDCVYDAAREQGIINAEELTTLSCPEAGIADITELTQFPGITNVDLTGNDHISCTQLEELRYSYPSAELILSEQCNLPPIVAAQQEQTVETGTQVDLNAEATDPNGDSLAYNWQQTAGQSVALTNPNAATPSFTAPQGEDQTITFQLTVTDQYGLSATQAINILVTGAILGSKDNPFLVTNYEDLKKVGTGIDGWNLDSHYLQTADIDATPSKTENPIPESEEEYYGFEPIGNQETPFTGGYDGGGFTIDGLTINRPEESYVGLFGSLRDGNIQSIILYNLNIKSGDYSGGLAGRTYRTNIINCHIEDSIISGNDQTGGLVGYKAGGTVVNSSAIADVSSTGLYSGGLIGFNSVGSVEESYTGGSVSSGSFSGGLIGYSRGEVKRNHSYSSVTSTGTFVGGLIGRLEDGNLLENYAVGDVVANGYAGGLVGFALRSSIDNSYSRSKVTSSSKAGGLVGQLSHYEDGVNKPGYSTITNSYSSGQVILSDEELEMIDFGGLIGASSSELHTVSNAFWDIETSGIETSAGGTPKTSEELKTTTTFTNVGWDFDQTWMILSEGYTYPRLAFNTVEVGSWTDLSNMRNNMHANYVLTRDLLTTDADYAELAGADANDGKGWEPVGTGEKPFMGTFDGGGFTIDGLTINRPGEVFVGMIGKAIDSHYANIKFENESILGNMQVGGIVGFAESKSENTSISNSSVSGEVFANNGYAGGLAGFMVGDKGGVLLNSSVIGNVSSNNNYVGGLVGMMAGSSLIVSESFFDGDLLGTLSVGGLVGEVAVNIVKVTYSYSKINITVDSTILQYVGGIIGRVSDGEDGQLTELHNIYADGDINIKGGGSHIAGIVGSVNGKLIAGNINANVDIYIDGPGLYVGGFGGFFIGDVSKSYSTGSIEVLDRGYCVGGFGGYAMGDFSESYSTGDLQIAVSEDSTTYVGGFTGRTDSGAFTDIYATGNVSAPDGKFVGGLIGQMSGDVNNSYSTGLVEGITDVGGLIGVGGGEVTNSFWDIETSGLETSAGGTGLTTEEMQDQYTFESAGWDFDSVWEIEVGSYPALQ